MMWFLEFSHMINEFPIFHKQHVVVCESVNARGQGSRIFNSVEKGWNGNVTIKCFSFCVFIGD